jgi:hypothetical protein
MFSSKRIFAVMLVGALLGTSALASGQASAAHSRVVGPLPAQFATLSTRKRMRRRRTRVRTIVWRLGVRVRGAGTIRPGRKTVQSRRPLLGSDPDVVLRARRRYGEPLELHGAARVASGAMSARRFAPSVRPALVNGAAGAVAFDGERPFAVLAFTVIDDRAVAIDVFNDPELVGKLDIRGITA